MNPQLSDLLCQLQTWQPWLIDAASHAAFVRQIENAPAMAGPLEDLIRQREAANAMAVADGNAEIPANGVFVKGAGPYAKAFGAINTDEYAGKIRQAMNSPAVRSILLTFNSPGGMVQGIPETAALIAEAAAKKPVIAFSDSMMASAAYWLGSQAGMVIASESATVGSVGVFVPTLDSSKAFEMAGLKVGVIKNAGGDLKAGGLPGTSLTEAQVANLQERVDELFGMFKGAILAKRPIVEASAMRGQTFFGSKAKSARLVDRLGSHVQAWDAAHRAGLAGPSAFAVSPLAEYEALKRRMISASSPLERGHLLNEMREHAAKHAL